MAFLSFPVYFSEDDFEEKENLGLAIKTTEGVVSINTQQIVAYNEMDNKHTMTRLSNGDCFECPLGLEEFENILSTVENIVDLSAISQN